MMCLTQGTLRWMMAPSTRDVHLRCSKELKERWLKRWRLCGRAQKSGDDGQVWESKILWLTYLVRPPRVITLISCV